MLVDQINQTRGSGREAVLQRLQESMHEAPEKALMLEAAMKVAERRRERGLGR